MEDRLLRDCCTVTECRLPENDWDVASRREDELLSVVVIYDRPFDALALDEALFSLAIQDYENVEVVLVMPDCGRAFHRRAEQAILAQSWPSAASARVVSVPIRASETISASLLNAGTLWATGRYGAFLHHQDLVYQHAYPALIERLRTTDAVAAFGGVRLARHTRACRHWMVAGKDKPKASSSQLSIVLNAGGALHAFVWDRARLDENYLFAHNPESSLAATMFLARLVLHEKADFALIGDKIVEIRLPPVDSASPATGRKHLPSISALLTSLAGQGVALRTHAFGVSRLFADLVRCHETPAA